MELSGVEYQYYLLPSANPPPHCEERHNQIYGFWTATWGRVLEGLRLDPACLADDFLRQDFIAAICTNSEVVAVHLYSFFSLSADASRRHRYLAGNYPPDFFTKVAALGTRTAISMEYLTVNPAFRKTKVDFPWGAVIGGLGLEVLCHYGMDAMIAPARRDHKVHEMAYAQGGECIAENVLNHNVPCDLVLLRRERIVPCPDSRLEEVKRALWAERVHVNSLGFSEAPAARRLKMVA